MAPQKVSIPTLDGGSMPAWLAPAAGGRGPGLVLMQEIFGVNETMRNVAAWYAQRGVTVICPDLFWRQQPGVELTDRTDAEWQKAFGYMKGMDERLALEDCAAARDHLRSHPACTGAVGAVGYCMGGRLAFLFSARYRPDAAVGYYGVGLETRLAEASGIRTPLMLHLAGRDSYCPPPALAAIHGALESIPLVTLHDYPDQGHAFSRPGGKHYDRAAAELADLRTLEFFCRHLAAPGTSMSDLWEEHVRHEFATRDTQATLQTMTPDAYVNHVPVLTGGVGLDQLGEFYSTRFIPKMPPDTRMTPVSRTIGSDRLVDEMVFHFTHTIEMDWMLPGVAPTGRAVSVPLVVIVHFKGDRLAHEHIYWDQAGVLAQLGLLDEASLPVAGASSAAKVMQPASIPSNQLIERAGRRR